MVQPPVVYNNGDVFLWKMKISKEGITCPYTVNVSVPAGLQIIGFSSTKPTATFIDPVVNVGSLNHGEMVWIYFDVEVIDISQAIAGTFTLTAVVNGCDTNPLNNTIIDVVTVNFIPPVAGAVDDPFGCVCGNVATNDTPCSTCTTEYRLLAGSEVNCTVSMNVNTGEYQITYIDILQPWSFQYHIWCVNCSDGNDYQVSGPATVSGAALATTTQSYQLVKEDFLGLINGNNTVVLGVLPLPGEQVFVYRNGLEEPQINWSIFGQTITFTLPFGNSPFGGGSESVTVHYWIP